MKEGDKDLFKTAFRNPVSRKRLRDVAYEEIWTHGTTDVAWCPGLPKDIWGKIIEMLEHDDRVFRNGNLLRVSKQFSAMVLRYFKFDKNRVNMEKFLVMITDDPPMWETYGFASLEECVSALRPNTNITRKIQRVVDDYLNDELAHDCYLLRLIPFVEHKLGRLAIVFMREENPYRDARTLFYLFDRIGFGHVPLDTIFHRAEDDYAELMDGSPVFLHGSPLSPTFYQLMNMYSAYRYMAKVYYAITLPELLPGKDMTPLTMFKKVDVKK